MRTQIPTISFIVPVYRTAAYLADCLESLLRQTISKEIIIIDDGSPDNSLAIALDYARRYPFIRVIHSQNEGLSAARNKGMRLAVGEYLLFVDSDDYLLGDALGEIVAVAGQCGADVVKLQRQLFLDSDPHQTEVWEPVSPLQENEAKLYRGYRFFIALSHQRWVPCVCWSLYRRDYLMKKGLFFVEGILAEDQIFYTQLLTQDPDLTVLEMPLVIYAYRAFRATGITGTKSERYFEDIRRVIAWLQQWAARTDFTPKVKQGIGHIITHLEYAVGQHR